MKDVLTMNMPHEPDLMVPVIEPVACQACQRLPLRKVNELPWQRRKEGGDASSLVCGR